jgi:hypothetical protein
MRRPGARRLARTKYFVNFSDYCGRVCQKIVRSFRRAQD